MKSNTDILRDEDYLDAVRGRLGWKPGKDAAPYDARINEMSPGIVVAKWVGWHLGDESWAHEILRLDALLRKVKP